MKRLIKHTLPVILIFVGLALTSCNNKTKGVLLRYNTKVGETITLNTTITQSSDLEGQGMSTLITMKMEMTTTDKTDSLVYTQSRLKEMTYKTSIMGETVSFDSNHMEDADPSVAANFQGLLDRTFDIVFDIYGNVVSAPEDYPQEQGFTAVFPKEMVYVGSQWSRETDNLINGIAAHYKGTYTVKKITAKTTELDLTGTVTADALNGEFSGKMLIDNETGITISASMDMPTTISTAGITVTLMQTITITAE